MANPTTDVNTLINASGCYSGQVLGRADRLAINVYLLAAQLNAIGGTNYVGNLERLLIGDSVCYSTLQPDELMQVWTQINNLNAAAAGATIGDVSAQLLQAACIRNASQEQLYGMILYLLASLGRAKTYPQ